MGVGYLRLLFVVLAAVIGHQIGSVLFGLQTQYGLYGALTGALAGLVVVILEKLSDHASLRGMSAAIFGLLLALIIANLLSAALDTIEMDAAWRASVKLVLTPA